jgi:GTPase
MAEPKRTDLSLRAERAVLAQVVVPRSPYDADETLEELENLARTAGALVLGQVRQKREKPDPKRYLGKGKLEELQTLCRAVDADVVITDDELSPAQVRTLEAALDLKVVDRSEVILDIFAAHANTVQARLQVELAQLQYEFPRLKRMWTHLDRTAGGTVGGPVGGGIGVRGPGERQLEVDRRLVQRHIQDLKRKLERRPGRLHQRRQVEPDERADRRRRLRRGPPLRDPRHPHAAVGAARGAAGAAERHGRIRA